MPIELHRLRRHNRHQENLAKTKGDKEALVTLCIPRPRKEHFTVHARTQETEFEFEVEADTYDYVMEEHVRALPPEQELERARLEGRLQDGRESYYSRFYNDNQIDKGRIRTNSRWTPLSFDNLYHGATHEDESKSCKDIVYREQNPGDFKKVRAATHARFAAPRKRRIRTVDDSLR